MHSVWPHGSNLTVPRSSTLLASTTTVRHPFPPLFLPRVHHPWLLRGMLGNDDLLLSPLIMTADSPSRPAEWPE